MLDLLYSEQPIWSRSDSSDEIVDALLKISAKSGIEKGTAISCLEDQEKAKQERRRKTLLDLLMAGATDSSSSKPQIASLSIIDHLTDTNSR